jgi:hypothetical protein
VVETAAPLMEDTKEKEREEEELGSTIIFIPSMN